MDSKSCGIPAQVTPGEFDMLQVLEQGMKIERQTMIRDLDDAVSMLCFFERQKEWATKTFGDASHRGPNGPLDHLAKEAMEAIQETDPEKKKEEIADCLFVSFEAAWRHGMSYGDLAKYATKKLDKNKARKWPPLSEQRAGKAVEHVRDGEPEIQAGILSANEFLKNEGIDAEAQETEYEDSVIPEFEDETSEFVDLQIGEHTPEPWQYQEAVYNDDGDPFTPSIYAVDGSVEGALICRLSLPLIVIPKREDEIRIRLNGDIHANGRRIVDCVNAMAGVKNPQEFIQSVDDLLKAYFAGPRNRDTARNLMNKLKTERGQI